MWWSSRLLSVLIACTAASFVSATRLIESNALSLCQNSPNFTATYFSVRFTPNNQSLALSFDGVAAISGYVTADVIIYVYGYEVTTETLNPCTMNVPGLCPMNAGNINVPIANIVIPDDVVKRIPGIAYTVPDLDASVRVYINSTDAGGTSIACIEATLSNGKTVYQKGVGWATAVISGVGLIASAVTASLGNSNTAAHVAANVLAFFGFMQAQAMFGMSSVHMPPIVTAWTQNFQWSMGIIRVAFLETICTWYQRATGGTPGTVLSELSTTSVEVMKRRKRSLEGAVVGLFKRADAQSATAKTGTTIVRGIKRVGFTAGIEATNIFLTGLIFFVFFVAVVMLIVGALKAASKLLARYGKIKRDKFADLHVSKGILYRMVQIGFPQMCVLCLWEFTQHDSAAEVLLAVVMLLSMVGALGWAAFKVIVIARNSVGLHRNPAYILFSDEACLNKLGFLYVQYRATAYYFLVPAITYIMVKAMFIGLSQPAPIVQTVALVIIETSMLIATSILRPWMDRKTNGYNITIGAINFVNAIFLLFFSQVFDQPGIVTGVMGVIFFVYNAAFVLVLLVLVLVTSTFAIFSKNPDLRYQPMRDDRGSFIKSQSQLGMTELDALGSTARGESPMKRFYMAGEGNASSATGLGAGAPGSRDSIPSHRSSASPTARSSLIPGSARGPSPVGHTEQQAAVSQTADGDATSTQAKHLIA
ncbi:transient receptor potential ion channel family protein [Aspergillus homomorphus CBS 101889]|uniref:TRP-domain-containing protein n=1 Tax=Aspergillus homomorphus (strain CBS 101889) TaxID=1450537 RepID=A0A395HWS2_ASPHC|nr:TRP-domain-containing protein [Aspergillus homomorphus CBS 101889]RAL11976.1 TRP-domain-containing protein [Aspergillus homomorphus CBS 101889]